MRALDRFYLYSYWYWLLPNEEQYSAPLLTLYVQFDAMAGEKLKQKQIYLEIPQLSRGNELAVFSSCCYYSPGDPFLRDSIGKIWKYALKMENRLSHVIKRAKTDFKYAITATISLDSTTYIVLFVPRSWAYRHHHRLSSTSHKAQSLCLSIPNSLLHSAPQIIHPASPLYVMRLLWDLLAKREKRSNEEFTSKTCTAHKMLLTTKPKTTCGRDDICGQSRSTFVCIKHTVLWDWFFSAPPKTHKIKMENENFQRESQQQRKPRNGREKERKSISAEIFAHIASFSAYSLAFRYEKQVSSIV